MGLTPGAGLSKDEVNYRQHEKCKTCNYFYNPGSCEIVAGNISADNVCDKWELGTEKDKDGKDGEFYQREYAKTTEE
jgi:hypothetical protein